MEPSKGPIHVAIKSNNTLPVSISDPKLQKKQRSLKMRRTSSTQVRSISDKDRSSETTLELEIIISLLTGSEYHKITETFDHRVSGVPAYLDMIKRIKPDLNMSMLQQVPTDRAISSVLQYHDFR